MNMTLIQQLLTEQGAHLHISESDGICQVTWHEGELPEHMQRSLRQCGYYKLLKNKAWQGPYDNLPEWVWEQRFVLEQSGGGAWGGHETPEQD